MIIHGGQERAHFVWEIDRCAFTKSLLNTKHTVRWSLGDLRDSRLCVFSEEVSRFKNNQSLLAATGGNAINSQGNHFVGPIFRLNCNKQDLEEE